MSGDFFNFMWMKGFLIGFQTIRCRGVKKRFYRGQKMVEKNIFVFFFCSKVCRIFVNVFEERASLELLFVISEAAIEETI